MPAVVLSPSFDLETHIHMLPGEMRSIPKSLQKNGKNGESDLVSRFATIPTSSRICLITLGDPLEKKKKTYNLALRSGCVCVFPLRRNWIKQSKIKAV